MESDPPAMLRAWLGEWEKLANSLGGDTLKSEEFTCSLHGAGGATMTMQAALSQAMDRALASTNLPSRTDQQGLHPRAEAATSARCGCSSPPNGAAPGSAATCSNAPSR